MRCPHRTALPGLLLALAAVVLGTACGTEADAPTDVGPTLSREEFISTFVDLRLRALRTETGVLSDSMRADVLGRHHVTEQDLLDFAEAHGEELPFMREVWDSVENRLDAIRPEPMSRPGESPSRGATAGRGR